MKNLKVVALPLGKGKVQKYRVTWLMPCEFVGSEPELKQQFYPDSKEEVK